MRNPIQATCRQTPENARAIVDAEYQSVRPVALTRSKILNDITSRLAVGGREGEVLDVLDRNEWNDENVAIAARIVAKWDLLK